jgi:hypothetical protein
MALNAELSVSGVGSIRMGSLVATARLGIPERGAGQYCGSHRCFLFPSVPHRVKVIHQSDHIRAFRTSVRMLRKPDRNY